MPLACFDAISNVSAHWKYAEGISLRYGIIVRVIFDGEIVFFGGVAIYFGNDTQTVPKKECDEIPLGI